MSDRLLSFDGRINGARTAQKYEPLPTASKVAAPADA